MSDLMAGGVKVSTVSAHLGPITHGSCQVNWVNLPGFTRYDIYWATQGTTVGYKGPLWGGPYTITDLHPNRSYTVKIYGWRTNGDKEVVFEGGFDTLSTKISFWTTGLSPTEFTLNWENHGVPIVLEMDGQDLGIVPGSQRSWRFSGLNYDQVYRFRAKFESYNDWTEYDVNTSGRKPTAPGYLGKYEHTIISVLLHWGPGEVQSGKPLYRVRKDELVLEETEDTAFRDLTPEQGRTYVYSVVTLDDKYNESERTTLTLSFDDLTPPTEISNLRTTDLNLQVLWDPAHDSSGRIKYHVYLDGDHKGTTEETAFSITEMESGKRYQICVEAEDASGNKSEKVCTSYPPLGISLKQRQ